MNEPKLIPINNYAKNMFHYGEVYFIEYSDYGDHISLYGWPKRGNIEASPSPYTIAVFKVTPKTK